MTEFNKGYWEKRCELAEAYLNAKLHTGWYEAKQAYNDFISSPDTEELFSDIKVRVNSILTNSMICAKFGDNGNYLEFDNGSTVYTIKFGQDGTNLLTLTSSGNKQITILNGNGLIDRLKHDLNYED